MLKVVIFIIMFIISPGLVVFGTLAIGWTYEDAKIHNRYPPEWPYFIPTFLAYFVAILPWLFIFAG
jgi:hypothetical protein